MLPQERWESAQPRSGMNMHSGVTLHVAHDRVYQSQTNVMHVYQPRTIVSNKITIEASNKANTR